MQVKGIILAVTAALSGCVGTSGGGGGPGLAYEYSTQCMFEINPPGAYVFNDGDDQVTAGGGATAEGAAAMNACIAQKAAADGKSALPDVAGVPQSVTAKTSGATVTETYTYGSPPAEAAKAPKAPAAAPAKAPKAPASSMPVSYGYCAKGGGVIQGGVSYCIAR